MSGKISANTGKIMAGMEERATTSSACAAIPANSLYARPHGWIKRGFDLLSSVILAIPACAILGICYVSIKLETKGPAFFVQQRPGYRGKVFKIYKLRTMIVETERDGRPLTDMERMTKIGKIIRACYGDHSGGKHGRLLPAIWLLMGHLHGGRVQIQGLFQVWHRDRFVGMPCNIDIRSLAHGTDCLNRCLLYVAALLVISHFFHKEAVYER